MWSRADRARVYAAVLIVVLAGSTGASGKEPVKDPAIEEFDVEYDLHPAQQFLYGQLAQYIESPELKGRGCDAPALRVAKLALFQYDLQTHFRSVIKELCDGVRDAAKLVGAKRLSRAAKLAGEFVEAYGTDQPEAAMGRALVNNGIDFAVDEAGAQAKTGKEQVDDKIKEAGKAAGEKAKEKLNDRWFRGELSKRITESFTTAPMSYCSPATVTVEFQKASKPGGRAGLFVQISGNCTCDPHNVAELRSYHVTYFMPQTGMDSKLVIDNGKFVQDVKELIDSSLDFRKAIRKSLGLKHEWEKGEEEEKDEKKPEYKKLWDDLSEKAGNAATLKVKLLLIPRFSMPPLDQVSIRSTCGCPAGSGKAGGSPPTETSTAPDAGPRPRPECEECEGLQLAAEKAAEEARDATAKRDAAGLRLQQAESAESAASKKLAAIASDPRFAHGNNPGQKRAEEAAAKGDLTRAREEAAAARSERDSLQGKPEEAKARAAKAREAYEACLKRCKEKKKTPTGVPPSGGKVDGCLVGQWVSTALNSPGYTGMTGIVLTYDDQGLETVDYSKSVPRSRALPVGTMRDVFRGTSVGHVATGNGQARRLDIVSNDATQTIEFADGRKKSQPISGGPAFLGIPGIGPNTYTCTEEELKFGDAAGISSFTFRRVGETRTKPATKPPR